VPESFPNAVPVYEALGAGRGRCANTTAPPRCSPFNYAARATLQACGREVAWNRGAGPARIWVAGCAALIVSSVVGSVDLAAYEYVNAGAPTPPVQPGAQPKLSLNDIE
jgi:hypothetical protein